MTPGEERAFVMLRLRVEALGRDRDRWKALAESRRKTLLRLYPKLRAARKWRKRYYELPVDRFGQRRRPLKRVLGNGRPAVYDPEEPTTEVEVEDEVCT